MVRRSSQVDDDPFKVSLDADGRTYTVQVLRRIAQPGEAPRLVVVSYQPNELAQTLLRVCIRAIQRYTPESHELWVVDNNSPRENVEWLLKWRGINVALNRTEPIPPEQRSFRLRRRTRLGQENWGSYANAVALELGAQLIDPTSRAMMALHMDALPCQRGWLSFLQSKLTKRTAAAGVRLERRRVAEGVLHVLGLLVDFRVFKDLGLDFLPALPEYDVGDRVTVALRKAGYSIFACRNTLLEPELAEAIPLSSPLRGLPADRAFDDEGRVIFLHLGRGVAKSSKGHGRGLTVEEWVRFVQRNVLQ